MLFYLNLNLLKNSNLSRSFAVCTFCVMASLCSNPIQCSAFHELNTHMSEMNNKLTSVFAMLQMFFESWKQTTNMSELSNTNDVQVIQQSPVPVAIEQCVPVTISVAPSSSMTPAPPRRQRPHIPPQPNMVSNVDRPKSPPLRPSPPPPRRQRSHIPQHNMISNVEIPKSPPVRRSPPLRPESEPMTQVKTETINEIVLDDDIFGLTKNEDGILPGIRTNSDVLLQHEHSMFDINMTACASSVATLAGPGRKRKRPPSVEAIWDTMPSTSNIPAGGFDFNNQPLTTNVDWSSLVSMPPPPAAPVVTTDQVAGEYVIGANVIVKAVEAASKATTIEQRIKKFAWQLVVRTIPTEKMWDLMGAVTCSSKDARSAVDLLAKQKEPVRTILQLTLDQYKIGEEYVGKIEAMRLTKGLGLHLKKVLGKLDS